MPDLKDKNVIPDFKFKQFSIKQENCSMKVGTDGVLLGAWADVSEKKKILDIGTGTGLIAIMLSQRNQEAQILGVEVDEAAAQEAKINIESCPWSERLKIEKSSIQDFSKLSRESFDLIVCNPPFFTGGTLSKNQDRNDVRHTMKLPNGDMLSSARKLLAKNGKFCCILPLIEGLRLKEMAEQYHLYCTKITEVKGHPEKSIERLLLQFELEAKPLEKDELIIQKDKSRTYTEDYISLTGDFYLKM